MIRLLELNDIEKIVQMENDNFGESLGYEMLSSEINNPLIKFFVIDHEETVIGYIGGYFFLEDGEILNFVIDKAYQHQGYGTTLFNYVLDYSKRNGIKKITLDVRNNNINAINFYNKYHFKQIAIRKHYYKDGSDALVMMKELI